jgi:hypothetical protein
VRSIAELTGCIPRVGSFVTVPKDLTSPCMSHGIIIYGGYLYTILSGQFKFTSLVVFTTLPFYHVASLSIGVY